MPRNASAKATSSSARSTARQNVPSEKRRASSMGRIKVHLDTDIGGDIDDLCALALLLNWPDVEITGITTVLEHGGKRAGYARYALALAGRGEVPVAAGA